MSKLTTQFRSFRAHAIFQVGHHYTPDLPDISFLQQTCNEYLFCQPFFFLLQVHKIDHCWEIVPALIEVMFSALLEKIKLGGFEGELIWRGTISWLKSLGKKNFDGSVFEELILVVRLEDTRESWCLPTQGLNTARFNNLLEAGFSHLFKNKKSAELLGGWNEGDAC